MAELFSMHGYGGYVWTAYGVFFLVLVADALAPIWRRRRTLSELRGRLKRQTTRSAGNPAKSETTA